MGSDRNSTPSRGKRGEPLPSMAGLVARQFQGAPVPEALADTSSADSLAHDFGQLPAPTGFEAPSTAPVQAKLVAAQRQEENKTGLPDGLKGGLENLSGMDMSGVRVHYNSPKPEKVQAAAYTQGQDIHVAPGQQKHVAHESWHVVQQAQGRVKPTMKAHGVAINDDPGLEKEADVMGSKASR